MDRTHLRALGYDLVRLVCRLIRPILICLGLVVESNRLAITLPFDMIYDTFFDIMPPVLLFINATSFVFLP